MTRIKKTLSLVLVFALFITGIAVTPKNAGAEEEEKYGIDWVGNYINIQSPYQGDYFDYDDSFELDKEDLNDDFGINLETGADAKYTFLRALAKYIREYVLYYKVLDDPTEFWELDEEKQAEAKEQANSLMPHYLDVNNGWINGISMDGKLWNTGAFSDNSGGTGSDGSWMFMVQKNGGEWEPLNDGVDSYVFKPNNDNLRNQENIKAVWCNYADENYSCLYTEISDPLTDTGVVFENEDAKFQVTAKNLMDYPVAEKKPVAGAKINMIDPETDSVVGTYTSDENGYFTVKKRKNDDKYYYLKAYVEATNSEGKTYNKLSYNIGCCKIEKLPRKAKSVKAKVTGKKKAKKKNIKVTWKNGEEYADTRTVYQVEISSKKKSGYKKAGMGDGFNTKLTIKNKKKGTYYIRIKTIKYYTPMGTGEGEDATDSVEKKSGYTTPVKVKVK
ncbi:MAG: hypothetical protein K5639_05455 [Eubacterium sp.]|nr:hypothetical protein [Eubacterium sp.]